MILCEAAESCQKPWSNFESISARSENNSELRCNLEKANVAKLAKKRNTFKKKKC